jgi:hypothetical protein
VAESIGAIALEDAERDHTLKTLGQTRSVVFGPNGAAARLGIKESTLYIRIPSLAFRASTTSSFPHSIFAIRGVYFSS